MKRCWHVRCLNVVNGKRCWRRRSLRHPLAWYVRVPTCTACHSNKHWYEDKFRDKKELANPCRCSRAPYPHRLGTAASGGRFGPWACEHHCPF